MCATEFPGLSDQLTASGVAWFGMVDVVGIEELRDVSPEACRFVRQTLLGWSMAELAAQSRVSKDTIRRFEGGESVLPRTVDSLKAALTSAGIEFIASGKPTEDLELHLPDGTIVRRSRG